MKMRNNEMNKCKTTALKGFVGTGMLPCVPNISLVESVNTFMQILVNIKKTEQNYTTEWLTGCWETGLNITHFWHAMSNMDCLMAGNADLHFFYVMVNGHQKYILEIHPSHVNNFRLFSYFQGKHRSAWCPEPVSVPCVKPWSQHAFICRRWLSDLKLRHFRSYSSDQTRIFS